MPDGVVGVGECAVRTDVGGEPGEAATRPALQLFDMHSGRICIRARDARIHLKDLRIGGSGQQRRRGSWCRGVAPFDQQLGCLARRTLRRRCALGEEQLARRHICRRGQQARAGLASDVSRV